MLESHGCCPLAAVLLAGTGFDLCDPVTSMAPLRGFFMARIPLEEHC